MLMKAWSIFLYLLFTFFLSGVTKSQMRYGLPPYKIFTVDDYKLHPQTWATAQLRDGRIVIGTSGGIVVYDGNKFTPILSGEIIRVLKVDTISGEERIYYGGDDVFGYLKLDSLGNYVQTSLSDSLPEQYKDFVVTLGIERIGNTTYISCLKRLFIFKDDTLYKTIAAPKNSMFFYLFKIYNRFFLYDNTQGILEIQNDTLAKLPNTGFLAYRGINYIFPVGNGKIYIIAARPYQIYMYNLNTDSISLVHTGLDRYLLENGMGDILKLRDGRWVIGTITGGLVVTNKDFSPLFIMNSTNSLEDNYISGLFLDNQDNIWFTSNNGFGVIYYPNEIFKISNKKAGIKNIPTNLIRERNYMYISTLEYFSKYKLDSFPTLKNNFLGINKKSNEVYRGQVMDFQKVGYNEFVITGRFGAYYIKNDQPKLIDSSFIGYNLLMSRYDSSLIYTSTVDGLVVLKKECGEWKKLNGIKFNSNGTLIYETKPRQVYIALRNHIFKKIVFDSSFTKYTVKNINFNNYNVGFPPSLFSLDDTLFLFYDDNNRTKVLYLDETKDTLLDWHYKVKFEHNSDNYSFPGYYDNSFLKKDTTYIFLSGYYFTRVRIHADTIYLDNKDFRSIKTKGLFNIYYDKDEKLVWGISTDYLYNIPFNYEHDTKPFNCLITSVYTAKDSLLAINNVNPLTVLSYKFNTLTFSFAAPYFERSDAITYSYFLEGFDNEWSTWDKESFTKYTNLPPGDYTFIVKAKNVYGEESREATFTFTILPPWYMTWWAYLLYVILGIGLIIIVVKLYVRRLKAANERLERIVAERTKELREKNLELQEKNELITNSIEYAKKIQDAILPSENYLRKVFPESFVLFFPRDIVSGDFFWLYKINDNETIVAISDCTGHGVPGAFMSMIGNTLLNEIVKEKRIFDPDEILNLMHKGIINSLQERGKSEITADGMDIVVCKINTEEKAIEIGSANQNAFLFLDGQLITCYGDPYSIGDPFAKQGIVQFNKFKMTYKEQAMIYLTSDGYYDQFGGEENKKFTINRFISLLKEINTMPIEEQKNKLVENLMAWKKSKEQIDDIIIVGIRLNDKM